MTTAAGSIHRLDGPSGRTGRGVTTMARIQFRTSWRPLLAWPTGLVGFLVITGVSLRSLYPTAASVKEYAAAFSGGTAYAVVNGTPYGIDTLPGVINYEFGFLAGIGLPLMGLLLANRLTRAEEESGRVELVRAGHVSRSAPLTSAVLLLTISLVAVGVGGLVVMLAYGARLGSAAAYGVGLTALGLFFAALTALVAQVVSHARTVVGVSLATLAVTYLVRGVGDLRDSWITYLSPIGWTEQVRAFDGPRPWLLALSLGASVCLTGVAFALNSRRDLGSGAFPSRPGPARASAGEQRVLGFAVRQHAGTALGWAIGTLVGGLMFGILSQEALNGIAENSAIQDVLGQGASVSENASVSESAAVDGYLYLSLLLITLAGCAFAVQGVGRLREEEREGRLEARLAGPVGRLPWLISNAAVLAVSGALVVGAGGLALGLSDAYSRGTWDSFGAVIGASLVYLAAILLVGAVALAAFAIIPRFAAVGWVPVAWIFIVALLGESLQLPTWARNLSPVHALGILPQDDVDVAALAWILILTVGAVGAALVGFRRRDIPR